MLCHFVLYSDRRLHSRAFCISFFSFFSFAITRSSAQTKVSLAPSLSPTSLMAFRYHKIVNTPKESVLKMGDREIEREIKRCVNFSGGESGKLNISKAAAHLKHKATSLLSPSSGPVRLYLAFASFVVSFHTTHIK
jgi:hypothetical protein